MSPRATLLLMIVFLVLGSFAIFDPLRRKEKQEAEEERKAHVAWLKDSAIESISIRGRHPELRLECALKEKACPYDGTGEWVVRAPFEDGADPSSAGTLASSLLNLKHNDRLEFESPPDPAEFGLDRPVAELSLRLKGRKEELSFRFGKASATGPDLYLSVSSEPKLLYLVPSYLSEMINKEPFHWRNKRLFPALEAGQISRLGWKSGVAGELRAFRFQEGWRLERPLPVEAGKLMLDGLASSLAFASAKAVYAPLPERPNAAKELAQRPELEIDFASEKGGAKTLRLYPRPGTRPRELLARVGSDNLVYVVDAAAFERFAKPLLEYRRRSLLDELTRNQVSQIRFTFPREHREIHLKASGNVWSKSGGEDAPGPLSQSRINDFLDQLRDSPYVAMFSLKGPTKEARAYRSAPSDLYLELKDAQQKLLLGARFLVHDRKVALTESEGDVRSLGEDFLRVLPVRMHDLTQAAAKQVISSPVPPEEDDHGHHNHPAPPRR